MNTASHSIRAVQFGHRGGRMLVLTGLVLAACTTAACASSADLPKTDTTLNAEAVSGAADCPSPSEVLDFREVDLAFEGVVIDKASDTVSLQVDRVFRGELGEYVNVRASNQGAGTVGGFTFEDGKKYLVAALGGEVAVCGASGAATPELLDLYESKFSVTSRP